MCSEELQKPLNAMAKDGQRILSPDMATRYSFEYCFRLLLVYCYTRKSTVEAIKDDDREAFESLFLSSLDSAIQTVSKDRGIALDQETLQAFRNQANAAIVGYLKSSMRASPANIARNLAKDFDDALRKSGAWSKGSGYLSIYAEERR